MGWMGQGFQKPPENENKRGTRRFFTKQGETKRVLFLSNTAQTAFEHSFKYNGFWQNHICMVRNIGLEDRCPMCDLRREDENTTVSWPRFVSYFYVISMTPYYHEKKGRSYCYSRELLVAQYGSDENPGVSRDLEKLAEEHGGLAGCVFDFHRKKKNEEGVGAHITFIEKISADKLEAYRDETLQEWCERINEEEDRDGDKELTVEKLLKYNPWEDGDIEEEMKPKSLAELDKMFPKPSGGKKKKRDDDDDDRRERKSKTRRSRDDDDDDADDDLPY